ncbi:endo xylanase [Penicillium chermesinum]|uniref:Endo xylanase n=1 Tax=Penicillium chermesinum TaxID=63820 RepID=A0A9W9TYL2_9EURO|nr:endo xylanase [Penicillium chermesinum]KAJ5248734.1 endo xylanase [Penicillium chermesinum]KAJ6150842.1 endo xylanase [Penicillium chermesinum]
MLSYIPLALAPLLFLGRLAAAEAVLALNVDFPDPCVIQTDNGYYAFSTASGDVNAQVASSPDFSSWTLLEGTDALPGPFPSWVGSQGGRPQIWAPDVIQRADGTYVMYFAAVSSSDTGKHCVGAATSTTITGPYTPEENVLACPLSQGGAIDAAGFIDGDQYYVVYKVDGSNLGNNSPTPIMLQAMESDAVTPSGDPVQILDHDDGDGGNIEAPSLVNVDGIYYLSFSSSIFDQTTYDSSYATATSITGPYAKAHTPNAPLLVTGDPSNVGTLTAPGGLDFSADGTKIVFAAWISSDGVGSGRAMYTASVQISDDVVKIL